MKATGAQHGQVPFATSNVTFRVGQSLAEVLGRTGALRAAEKGQHFDRLGDDSVLQQLPGRSVPYFLAREAVEVVSTAPAIVDEAHGPIVLVRSQLKSHPAEAFLVEPFGR